MAHPPEFGTISTGVIPGERAITRMAVAPLAGLSEPPADRAGSVSQGAANPAAANRAEDGPPPRHRVPPARLIPEEAIRHRLAVTNIIDLAARPWQPVHWG
jgi:hypothetical protein